MNTPRWLRPRPAFVQLLLVAGCMLAGQWSRYQPGTAGALLMVSSHPTVRPYTFPEGGRTLFPRYRLVALYGTPGVPVLGALGQQPLQATIRRAQGLAKQYQPYMQAYALPTLEIITTVASASPEPNNSYSYGVDPTTLAAWIDAAQTAGVYVVLDLQPGREDFLTQAKRYQALLERPNVGLAFDPEWRLGPDQLPLEQIGSVSAAEVNRTTSWLAALTRARHLPQKLVVLHEFRLSMLPDRQRLVTADPSLAFVIQMDGQGSQAEKLDTWHSVTAGVPAQVHFGWKNFYKKDTTLRSPQATMALSPQPWYVSYQ